MNPPMDCPRCGQAAVSEPTCPRCGVIVAKARAAGDRRATAGRRATTPPAGAPAPAAERASTAGNWLVTLSGLSVILVVGLVVARTVSGPARPGRVPAPVPAAASSRAPAVAVDEPPPTFATPAPPALEQIRDEVASIDLRDREQADAITRRLATPAALTAGDVGDAEALLSRHPDEKGIRNLLEAVLEAVASNEANRRQFAEATAHLRRAAEVQPGSVRPVMALAQLHLSTGDWPSAEAAFRAVLAIEPRNAPALRALGFALLRQDRNREAAEVLRAALEIEDDSPTRALLGRLQKGMADEKGMTEQRLSHFNVRYDGEPRTTWGARSSASPRAPLRDPRLAPSTTSPANTVPVILFSQQGYYDAAGAPAWSGGAYDNFDGRIRIPIGGADHRPHPGHRQDAPPRADPRLHRRADEGRGPPRDPRGAGPVHGGQALGRRCSTPEQMRALADGQLGGVGGFYLGALSFVEYLVAQRGPGGMNDSLKAMGETGNLDEAFRQVYGPGLPRLPQQAWQARLRQQHGS